MSSNLKIKNFQPNLPFCRGCIYYNKDSEKCRRFNGYKIGIDKKGRQYCIVKDQ